MSGNNGNSNDTDLEIELMVTFSRQVFEAAQRTLAAMPDGGRIQIKDLAKSVGQALSKDSKEVLGFVNHFVHRTTIAYVTRGKNGGIVKGTRPVKVVKAPKKVKVDLTAPLTPSDGVDGQAPETGDAGGIV
jgi:hypothetical protein